MRRGVDSHEHYHFSESFSRTANEPGGAEATLQSIIDAIPALVWCTRADGFVEFINQRWATYTGSTPVKGDDLPWNAVVHPNDLHGLQTSWKASESAGRSHWCEARLRRSDGVFRWFLLHLEPLRDKTGRALRWRGTAIDIDDRKQTESLRAAEKRTLEMIADGANLRDVLDHLCSSIDFQVAPSVTTILLMDPDGKRLWQGGGPSVSREWISIVSPIPVAWEAGLCGTAAFLKKRVVVTDVATDPCWPDQYRDLAIRNGIRAAWSEPILTKDNNVLGTFALYCSESREPTEDDLALIASAARIALIAIERQRSQEALKSALEEIRKSETTLRRVIDTIPACAWCARPDGSMDYLNKRWHDYTGLSAEAARDWGYQAAIHPDDRPHFSTKPLGLFASEGPPETEVRLLGSDGIYRWFLIRVEPFHDDAGKVVKWYGTSTDIEHLKRTQEKLREDEREFRRITDAIPQAIVVMDPDGIPLYANRATLDYTGFKIEDVQLGFRERIFHPDDVERLRDERQASLARGLPFEVEQRALGKNGQYRWFLIRYNPFRDERGCLVRWYATGTDIDDRKRDEERTRNENVALREEIDRSSMFEEIVGSSKSLQKVLNEVDKVAITDSTVLILGETGTGKELIARAIHRRSRRATRAFIRVNCAAIPAALIASELFGHEKGAFTGAVDRRIGRFEAADGGTLFLDEVGDLPAETQIALLRVLQEREIERVGSAKPIPVDVRVLSATNKDLASAVEDGSFRRDLYYRLNVFPVSLPPLRERPDDILLLVEYLVQRYSQKAGKRIANIDRKTLNLFEAYHWPGNVRELQNVIDRALILCDGPTLYVEEAWFRNERVHREGQPIPLSSVLTESERNIIERALLESAGRIGGPSGAAAKLGIPRQTLESKIKVLGINKFHYKRP
jgi:formate hydrogenlyase transcriptional activator